MTSPRSVNWCFSPTSVVRSGWGAISASEWGGYGAAGLIGSTTDQGGYGFSMNSYLYPMALVPAGPLRRSLRQFHRAMDAQSNQLQPDVSEKRSARR